MWLSVYKIVYVHRIRQSSFILYSYEYPDVYNLFNEHIMQEYYGTAYDKSDLRPMPGVDIDILWIIEIHRV